MKAFFWRWGTLGGKHSEADRERRTYRQRKIDGDGFREIVKTASSVVLSLIYFILKIFQSVMNITMN